MKRGKEIFVCLFLASTVVLAVAPGTNVFVSESALNYVKDVMLPKIVEIVLKTKIPDVSGKTGTPIGNIEYKLSSIHLERFTVGTCHVSVEQPSTAAVSIGSLATEIKLNWHYREKAWPHISDSGHADAKTSRATAHMSIAIGSDPATGRPTAHISGCSVDLADLSIHLSGGASWLYQIFVDVFAGQIKHSIQSSVCGEVTGDVDKMLAEALKTLPVQQPIGHGLAISYGLVGAPRVETQGPRLAAPSAGEIYAESVGPGHTPLVPPAMPSPGILPGAMFEADISEYTFGSVGWGALNAGLLKTTVTKDMAPPAASIFFTTSFFKAYAPGLWEKYGKADVQLGISANDAPKMTCEVDNFVVLAPVVVTVFAKSPTTGAFEKTFSVLANAECIGKVEIKGTSITGELQVLNATTSLVETLVGPVDIQGMGELFTFALTMAQEAANAFLEKGFPLPTVEGISFVNPVMKFETHFLSIGTDIHYDPPKRVLEAPFVGRF